MKRSDVILDQIKVLRLRWVDAIFKEVTAGMEIEARSAKDRGGREIKIFYATYIDEDGNPKTFKARHGRKVYDKNGKVYLLKDFV